LAGDLDRSLLLSCFVLVTKTGGIERREKRKNLDRDVWRDSVKKFLQSLERGLSLVALGRQEIVLYRQQGALAQELGGGIDEYNVARHLIKSLRGGTGEKGQGNVAGPKASEVRLG